MRRYNDQRLRIALPVVVRQQMHGHICRVECRSAGTPLPAAYAIANQSLRGTLEDNLSYVDTAALVSTRTPHYAMCRTAGQFGEEAR